MALRNDSSEVLGEDVPIKMESMNGRGKICPIRPLEDLSKELSEIYCRPVEVVDVLVRHNNKSYHSLITGTAFDVFFSNYEFNKPGFSCISIETMKALNSTKNGYDLHETFLIYKNN